MGLHFEDDPLQSGMHEEKGLEAIVARHVALLESGDNGPNRAMLRTEFQQAAAPAEMFENIGGLMQDVLPLLHRRHRTEARQSKNRGFVCGHRTGVFAIELDVLHRCWSFNRKT